MKLNKKYWTLLEEAKFTFEILASGVNQLGKVSYAKKGLYFSSFTSLSTGLERLGKLCLILDFYIKNNGQFPYEDTIKFSIGHDLEKLYTKSKAIINDYELELQYLKNLDDYLHKDILSILSRFAKGDRYSNINYLVNSNFQSDPIFEWNAKIDTVLFEMRVSKKKKDEILFNSKLIDRLAEDHLFAFHYSESRKEINNIGKASYLTGVSESVAKYRQLYVLQIIRYWVNILTELQYKAIDLGKKDIPFFTEIFVIFNSSDSYFLQRKTYDKL